LDATHPTHNVAPLKTEGRKVHDSDYLVVGQVFEKFGMCKQVLTVTIDENTFLDGCVQWCHPGSQEVHTMWLPLWLKWAKTATRRP
jgi:hypothetical protein